ncbi:organomercurial lyase [Streptomyces fradiae]|uniref:organomercurial lyase n=1 Tax=Streptomyces fradiae TaxID=1906 RepID=UPI0035167B39
MGLEASVREHHLGRPVSGALVQVEFAGGTTSWKPDSAVVFSGAPVDGGSGSARGSAEDVCCGYLRFFTDRTTAGQWARQQTGLRGAVMGQAEAEHLGAHIFGPLLNTTDR